MQSSAERRPDVQSPHIKPLTHSVAHYQKSIKIYQIKNMEDISAKQTAVKAKAIEELYLSLHPESKIIASINQKH
jgi:hypothetical protein